MCILICSCFDFQVFAMDQKKPMKKPKKFIKKYTELLFLLCELIRWMLMNEKIFPKLYFCWMLGDEFGWKHALNIAGNTIFQDYTLEMLHRTLPPIVEKAKTPSTWTYSLSQKDFAWFYYFYENRHHLPSRLMKKPFYSIIRKFRNVPMNTSLEALKRAIQRRKTQGTVTEIFCKQMSSSYLAKYKGFVIKNRDSESVEEECANGVPFIVPPEDILHIPDNTSFILKDIDTEEIIGGRIANAIPKEVAALVKKLMLQVLKVKKSVVRGESQRAHCSYMSSFGATKNMQKGDIGKINYIVSAPNKRAKMESEEDRQSTDTLTHKYGFSILQDIIIMVFLEYFPEGILEFLEKASTGSGSPYVPIDEGDLKENIGPLMWSLYVTMNYINKIHIDRRDRSDYSLAIVSNTNREDRGGEFYLLSHGARFRQCDRDIFFFKGQKLHGTGWREAPLDHVLVAALVVKSSVANIVEKLYKLHGIDEV